MKSGHLAKRVLSVTPSPTVSLPDKARELGGQNVLSSDSSYVLVTGAAGFVAVNIVKLLAGMKRRVLALDCVTKDPLICDYLRGLDNYVEWVKTDLADFDQVRAIAESYKIGGVIHAATFTPTQDVEQAIPREILAANLMGTVNTLELARVANVRRYVYVSSTGVYGKALDLTEPVTEDSIQPYLQMNNFYRIAKVTSEKLTERYSEIFPITTISMRLAVPYGLMERPTRTRKVMGSIFTILKLVLADKRKLIRVKGLRYARDWTFVMDTARGLVAGLDAVCPVSSVYNLSCGVLHSLEDILIAVRQVSGEAFDWVEVGENEDADLQSPGGSLTGPMSIRRAQDELGFTPQYNLDRGVKEYCEWWKDVTRAGLWLS